MLIYIKFKEKIYGRITMGTKPVYEVAALARKT
jgi:hypothetical protein